MKNVEEFVEKEVEIEFMEKECAVHFPFKIFVERSDNFQETESLFFDDGMVSCYRLFSQYKKDGARRIYMSIDFAKGAEMKKDYVMIFTYENGEINLFAIPYNDEGEILDRIEDSPRLSMIRKDFEKYL